MTTANPAPVPPPGSDAAIRAGCTCPVLDNAHGAGIGGGLWWIDSECPLHGADGYWQLDAELSDMHMRPRAGRGGAAVTNIDPNDIEDCQKQVADLEAEVRELRAALEAAKSQREAYKLSVYELREHLRHSVSEDALASAQDDLAGCRAALEQARALASRWRDTLCLFPNLEALVDEIDALMAAAPGGAA